MTAALLRATNTVELPAVDGVSERALRAVLGAYARICQGDGTLRWGISGSKIADLTRYSLRVVRRAQAALVEAGFITRVRQGGGRRSTHWSVVVDRLLPPPTESTPSDNSHGSNDQPSPQPRPAGTAHRPHTKMVFSRLLSGRRSGMSPSPEELCSQHGSAGGFLSDGRTPRCPACRRRRARHPVHLSTGR
jgi:hypothetical protein